ncbi:hypothetical protein BD324DRAFT_683593 [Kockovaella imperatae]|uniref:COX assembly mitochondrial protein n=1 Tax=Kockovaella imperatae TaxID=4999 RepID=A0A1Y1U814_9TREE|nr:hypothetical protein BD324DRAFT_683593 [Kockovaella imperatae]ORX34158.1 hypothetical protein BD324DRAFT_683593 [Kockovaella imperatae]
MQALSSREEADVKTQAREEAMTHCEQLVNEWGKCANGRTISMGWACKTQLKAWHQCIRDHVTEERLDQLRVEYLANRQQKLEEYKDRRRQEKVEAAKRQAGIKN